MRDLDDSGSGSDTTTKKPDTTTEKPTDKPTDKPDRKPTRAPETTTEAPQTLCVDAFRTSAKSHSSYVIPALIGCMAFALSPVVVTALWYRYETSDHDDGDHDF